MTIWTRTFHNPLTMQTVEATSDEPNLPRLRARIVTELHADAEWEDPNTYVHQPSLDLQAEGKHPEIVLKSL